MIWIGRNSLDIGLCTDGAPAMIGVRSGLAKKLKKNPLMTLDSAIRIVNYIKSSALNSRLFYFCVDLDSDHKVLVFHTEIRWLSKGNMLARLYELKEDVILFLEFREKHDFLTMFKDDTFQWRLAYLTDIFDSLNELNLKHQGRNNTIYNKQL
ncbi:unnamed protein product [Acanthoscelides obtectus]|uniref:Zinc finger BED domain-containing protein 5 n=1 Tax=Acanthoscelides obtectus TaxID=200917 RepID=A0A9P0MMW7_ACAOB|nr:unnamed protein product [Acanthoscelides obtectus]CAK1622512.1 Protein FAM200B [Acanthoscelides obtectus]